MRASLLFLGTGAPDAGSDDMPAVALRAGPGVLLLDSGEGVQHKMVGVGIGLNKVRAILITHLHGDHVLGLVPLVQTRTLLFKPTPPAVVLGPSGLGRFLTESFNSLYFDPGSSLDVQELRDREELKVDGISVRTEPLNHTVTALGYAISLSGDFRVCYLTDTRPLAGEGSDLSCSVLIHDSTFSWTDLERAMEFRHTTALEAAEYATRIGAKLLFLFHISSRYKDRGFLEREARRHHPNAYATTKYMHLSLTL